MRNVDHYDRGVTIQTPSSTHKLHVHAFSYTTLHLTLTNHSASSRAVTQAVHSATVSLKKENMNVSLHIPEGDIFPKHGDLLQELNTKTLTLEGAPEELQLAGILPIIQLGTIYLASN